MMYRLSLGFLVTLLLTDLAGLRATRAETDYGGEQQTQSRHLFQLHLPEALEARLSMVPRNFVRRFSETLFERVALGWRKSLSDRERLFQYLQQRDLNQVAQPGKLVYDWLLQQVQLRHDHRQPYLKRLMKRTRQMNLFVVEDIYEDYIGQPTREFLQKIGPLVEPVLGQLSNYLSPERFYTIKPIYFDTVRDYQTCRLLALGDNHAKLLRQFKDYARALLKKTAPEAKYPPVWRSLWSKDDEFL